MTTISRTVVARWLVVPRSTFSVVCILRVERLKFNNLKWKENKWKERKKKRKKKIVRQTHLVVKQVQPKNGRNVSSYSSHQNTFVRRSLVAATDRCECHFDKSEIQRNETKLPKSKFRHRTQRNWENFLLLNGNHSKRFVFEWILCHVEYTICAPQLINIIISRTKINSPTTAAFALRW